MSAPRPRVAVVSHLGDDHALAVLPVLDRLGAAAVLVDLAQFPRRMRLDMRYGPDAGHRLAIADEVLGELDLGRCRSVWWRRPQPFELPPEMDDPEHRGFAWAESQEAFCGLWRAMAQDCFWLNTPDADLAAQHKAFQLRVAQDVGLAIPRTLITNDPERVRAFVSDIAPGQVIFKAFTATDRAWRETRLVTPQDLEQLDCVRHAPVIFQAFVPAQHDLRVTAVGERLFAAAIDAREAAYPVDYRMDLSGARFRAWDLPKPVAQRLLALMRRLGLAYGAMDLRLTPEGEYVFLEVNPSGQWRFVEERTGQPITRAVAELLVRGGE